MLLLWFLATSLIPLAVVSAISYFQAKESLRDAAFDALAAKAEEKAAFIDNWFEYRFVDLESQATSTNNARFLGELRDAFQASRNNLGDFVKSYRWTKIAYDYDADLKSFRKMYDHYDVFLIDAEGNILFTVAKEEDFGTNLFDGPFAETHFATACRKALESGQPTFSDLDYYTPSGDAPVGFVASVIVNEEGEKLGVFAIQIRIDKIEDAMARKAAERGGNDTTYLVGFSPERGVTLRSIRGASEPTDSAAQIQDSQPAEWSGYLDQGVDTEQTRLWMEERVQDGTEAADMVESAFVYDGPGGVRVLGIRKAITVGGVSWGLIAEIPEQEAFAQVRNLGIMVLVLVIATGAVVVVIATIITSRIVRPIVQLSEGAERVARGDLTRKIEGESTNELGDLARSFNDMVTSLREAASLQEGQDWLKTAQRELGDQMRGEQEIASLARNVVTYLAKYLGAQLGAFYILDGPRHLTLFGSYAFRTHKNLAKEFSFGQGVVGQAALEKEHILLTNVPVDYIAVSLGLGEAPLRNILVWPIVREDEVKGVIELGALEAFGDRSLDLLNQVTENVAIAMDVAQARRRQQELLEESQAKSEKLESQSAMLQAREEELKSSNRAPQRKRHAKPGVGSKSAARL